uniref:Uncharacterized protein n=1 Tax=Moniliophthora roreri TaxID=221103 RepID=A0A0W0FYL7_MONRR
MHSTLLWAHVVAQAASFLRPEVLASMEEKHISIDSLADWASVEIGAVDRIAWVIIAFQSDEGINDDGGGIRVEDLACLSKQPTYLLSPSCNRVISGSTTPVKSPGQVISPSLILNPTPTPDNPTLPSGSHSAIGGAKSNPFIEVTHPPEPEADQMIADDSHSPILPDQDAFVEVVGDLPALDDSMVVDSSDSTPQAVNQLNGIEEGDVIRKGVARRHHGPKGKAAVGSASSASGTVASGKVRSGKLNRMDETGDDNITMARVKHWAPEPEPDSGVLDRPKQQRKTKDCSEDNRFTGSLQKRCLKKWF